MFLCEKLKIVAFICDSKDRHPVVEMLWKIMERPACRNFMEARAFIGISIYYRAWIKDILLVAEQKFQLFGHSNVTSKGLLEKKSKWKKVEFIWGTEQETGIEKLKTVLSSAPALKVLVYTPEKDGFVRGMVLGIDECGFGFGVIL